MRQKVRHRRVRDCFENDMPIIIVRAVNSMAQSYLPAQRIYPQPEPRTKAVGVRALMISQRQSACLCHYQLPDGTLALRRRSPQHRLRVYNDRHGICFCPQNILWETTDAISTLIAAL